MPSSVERRALTTSTRLPVAHERADRVDHGLRAAGAGQRVDGERLPADDPREHGLLLGIGVEQQGVGGRRTLVRTRRRRNVVSDAVDALAVVGVARRAR